MTSKCQFVQINDPELTLKWINSSNLERLEDESKLGKALPLFRDSSLCSKNGKHFPFMNEPDKYIISAIEDEIALTLSEISDKEYKKIIQLVRKNVDDDELLIEFAKISGNKFGRCEIDRKFLIAARKLPSLLDIVSLNGGDTTLAKQQITEYIGDDYIKIHNAIASTLLCPELIRKTILEPQKSIQTIITENAPLKYSLRVVKNEVVIRNKLLPKDTLILFNIDACAKVTGDTRFVFGNGSDIRRCPFGLFIEKFLEKLRVNDIS